MAVSCPSNPPAPDGYKVWQGAVPPELTQWAMDLRDHINDGFPYGTVWDLTYNGSVVKARKDHHTWTWKGGQLITGICIPGITLYQQKPATAASSTPGVSASPSPVDDPVATPDPTAAVFGANEEGNTNDVGQILIFVALPVAFGLAGWLLTRR